MVRPLTIVVIVDLFCSLYPGELTKSEDLLSGL